MMQMNLAFRGKKEEGEDDRKKDKEKKKVAETNFHDPSWELTTEDERFARQGTIPQSLRDLVPNISVAQVPANRQLPSGPGPRQILPGPGTNSPVQVRPGNSTGPRLLGPGSSSAGRQHQGTGTSSAPRTKANSRGGRSGRHAPVPKGSREQTEEMVDAEEEETKEDEDCGGFFSLGGF